MRRAEEVLDFLLLSTQFFHASFALNSQHGRLTSLRWILGFRAFDFEHVQLQMELQAGSGRVRPFTHGVLEVTIARNVSRRLCSGIDVNNGIEWTAA